MVNNDERYWDIQKLNKWFAISSILFMASMVWMFVDDNDDEFKVYQREFRKLEIKISEEKLQKELYVVEEERVSYEKTLTEAKTGLSNKSQKLDELKGKQSKLKAGHYNANMIYQGQKAEIDALKYLVEAENASHGHDDSHGPSHKDEYVQELDLLHTYKMTKEDFEIQLSEVDAAIKDIQSEVKKRQDELNIVLAKVDILDKKLINIDRKKMSFANKIADIVRDLPILDFMNPYYKVNQIVVSDVKYDVNFAAVPKVDRCTSCHLGIDNPDFSDAPQPYTTHPNLDLYITSASPHSMNSFACTSCHDGRGRGTTFISSTHTPNTDEDKERWKEEYDWKKMHHWLQPMLPLRYTQASCFKCHNNDLDIRGAETLNLGLLLVDKLGCNGCHTIEDYPQLIKVGPNLKRAKEKLDREWVAKWIKNPRSFRHNANMPSQFGQDNQKTPEMQAWNNNEIYAISSYLVKKNQKRNPSDSQYSGDAENGEKLFGAIGCKGCHVIEPEPVNAEVTLKEYTKRHGPNLIGMGSKTTAEWVYNWIRDPLTYNPDSRMPNLRVNDQDAKDITAYLLSFRNNEFENIGDIQLDEQVLEKIAFTHLSKQMPESFAEKKLVDMDLSEKLDYVAQKSIIHYGCFGCHEIDGFENAKPIGTELTEEGSKPVDKLDFGLFHNIEHVNYAWFETKLGNPRTFDQGKVSPPLDKLKMPNFNLTGNEIEALTTAILAFNSNKIDEKLKVHQSVDELAQHGTRLIKQYNCQGCHIIDGFGGQLVEQIGAPEYSPPNLNTQGEKTNPDWLMSFFNEPSIIRPNLQVRMPSFHQISDKDWNAIIKYFQHLDNEKISYHDELVFETNSIEFRAGEKLHELGACDNCHFYGETFPKQEASTWAPNLAMTKERLNPDWVKEWLRDPQTIMPGTKMPAPYLPDKDILTMDGAENDWGKELVKLGGDSTAMLNGLRDYMWNIKGKTNIDDIIKDYFDENGYDFESSDDDFDDEDDWGDDDDW